MKKILVAAVILFCLQDNLAAQTDSAIMNNNIRGAHKKHKLHGINSYPFNATSMDCTIGYGSAKDAQYNSSPISSTYKIASGYVDGGFPLIGRQAYREGADKGLVAGYDIIPGLSFGTATHNPPKTGIDNYSIGEIIKFGFWGTYRISKNYDIGGKILWGLQGNTAVIHDVRDRGWLVDVHARYRKWYINYERFLARSTAVERIFGDAAGYLHYPVLNNLILKYAISHKHYIKAYAEIASGNHTDLIYSYPNTQTNALHYSNTFYGIGFGWFVH